MENGVIPKLRMNQKMLSFKLNRLVIACACSFPIMSFAASTTDAEIQQLRDEVKALKLLMQAICAEQSTKLATDTSQHG